MALSTAKRTEPLAWVDTSSICTGTVLPALSWALRPWLVERSPLRKGWPKVMGRLVWALPAVTSTQVMAPAAQARPAAPAEGAGGGGGVLGGGAVGGSDGPGGDTPPGVWAGASLTSPALPPPPPQAATRQVAAKSVASMVLRC